jgi:hypothetical protein
MTIFFKSMYFSLSAKSYEYILLIIFPLTSVFPALELSFYISSILILISLSLQLSMPISISAFPCTILLRSSLSIAIFFFNNFSFNYVSAFLSLRSISSFVLSYSCTRCFKDNSRYTLSDWISSGRR